MIKSFEDLKSNVHHFPKSPVAWYRPNVSTSPGYSPTATWYLEESRKRSQGVQNEIDLNEIMAAKKGMLNRWSKPIRQFPDIFKEFFMSHTKINWEAFMGALCSCQSYI